MSTPRIPDEPEGVVASPRRGLAALGDVPLNPAARELLAEQKETSRGTAVWRARKAAEAKELLALEAITPRLKVIALDLRADLRALFALRTPVPCRPPGQEDLVVAQEAVLALSYPSEALQAALPGYAFLAILDPPHVWHPNVGNGGHPPQPLCLGARLPAGICVRELVIAAFGALTFQTVTMDEQDPAGLLNTAAGLWLQQNLDRVPLTREAFLDDPDGATGKDEEGGR